MDNFLTYDNAYTLIEKIGAALPQKATLPTASADWVSKIVQYTGSTAGNYTNGYFYKCVPGSTSGTYQWTPVAVQEDGGSAVQSDWEQTDSTADDYIKNKPDLFNVIEKVSTLPEPSREYVGKIYLYTGSSVNGLKYAHLYECRFITTTPTTYYWSDITDDNWIQPDWNQTNSFNADYIKNKPTLGKAAAKDSTNAVTANSTDLVESGAVKTAIDAAVSSAYHHAGTSTVAGLTASLLVAANEGNVYNITDSGITTSDFIEGAGKVINAGDNIGIAKIAANTYKFDLLSGFVDISGKADKVSGATAGHFAALDSNGNLTDSGKTATDFATASDMTAVKGVIPSTATTQNKLATASDVTGEDISSTSTTSPLTDSADGIVQGLTIKGRSHKSKNLLEITAETQTINGVTFTVNKAAGTITANGIATGGNATLVIWSGASSACSFGNKILSGGIDGDKYLCIELQNSPYTRFGISKDDAVTINPDISSYDNASVICFVRVLDSKTANNVVFRPMICTAADYEADPTFEPYFEGIKSVGDNGLTVTTANSDNTVTTSAAFTTALPLRGFSDTVRDKLTCTAESKQVETVCGEVDLGTLNYTYNSTYNVFITSDINYAISDTMLCTEYEYIQNIQSWSQLQNKQFAAPYGIQIAFKNTDYTDATAFKTAMSGVKLVYKLAEPVTTPLTDEEIAAFRGLRTYDSTTNITITDEPEFEINYLKNTENGRAVADIQTDLQGQIDDLDSSQISMTGYSKPSATSAIAPSDTVNVAIGKLEKGLEDAGGGDSIQVDVLPTASASNLGKIHQYIGTTTPNRRNGFFYKCVPGDVAGTYEWDNIDVQYGGIGGENHVYYDPIPEHTYLYGFDIHTLDSNPDTRVTYPLDVDNANYSPAYMDFANDVFNYGGWNLSPGQHFMPRPCMLNTDTTVAYYLNPNDYTKKADGTNSDVGNLSFDGNAMMEWNKIYTYREMDHNGTYRFRCSDVKLGPNWECWCNYDQQNHIIPHFYTRIYQGYVYSSKLRSISGQTPTDKIYMSSAIQYAGNVGNSYYPSVAVDRLLINDLLVLISKNTDTTEIFGVGNYASTAHNTGTMNTKGMFWGSHADQTTGVKVFGMEDWWGNFYNLELGIMTTRNSLGICKVVAKFTRGTKDGSTVSDYNNTGDGYLTLYEFADSVSGYISEMIVTPFGRFPRGADGSATEYETDRMNINNSDYPLFSFGDGGANGGAFETNYRQDSNYYSSFNFSLSCKPLVT